MKKSLENAVSRTRALGLPATLTWKTWAKIVEAHRGLCAYCEQAEAVCVEHFIPVDAGGGATPGNCLPACVACNQKKRLASGEKLSEIFGESRISELVVTLRARSTGPDVGPPPHGHRSGDKARSGPSGPSIPDAQRQRPARRVTLSPEAWALLDAQRAESEDSVSAQLDALVLSRGAEERHLSPAILERLQALAARRGDPLWLVADEVLDAGLDLFEASEGKEAPASDDPVPVVRELDGGGVAISYQQAK